MIADQQKYLNIELKIYIFDASSIICIININTTTTYHLNKRRLKIFEDKIKIYFSFPFLHFVSLYF